MPSKDKEVMKRWRAQAAKQFQSPVITRAFELQTGDFFSFPGHPATFKVWKFYNNRLYCESYIKYRTTGNCFTIGSKSRQLINLLYPKPKK